MKISLLLCLSFLLLAAHAQPSGAIAAMEMAIDDGFEAWALEQISESTNSFANMLEVKALLASGNTDAALDRLEEPDLSDLKSASFWRAYALAKSGEPGEALSHLDAFKALPLDAELIVPVLRLRIRCHLAMDHLDDAQAVVDPAYVSKGPALMLAPVVLDDAAIAWRRNDTNRLVTALERLRGIPADRPEALQALLWQAELKILQGDTAEGTRLMKEIEAAESAAPGMRLEVLNRLAQILEVDRPGEAIDLLARAETLETRPVEQAELAVRRGRLLLDSGDEAGIEVIRSSISLLTDPALASEMQLVIADSLYTAKRFPEAEKAYAAHLLAFTNRQTQVLAIKGNAWSVWHQDRPAEAASLFQRLYQDADPSDRETKKTALLKVADSQFAAEMFEEAAESYQRFSRLFFGDSLQPQAIFQGAICQRRLGNTELAERELQALSAFYPGTPFAEKANIEVASLHQERQNWSKASAMYEQYLSDYSKGTYRVEALLNQALCNYRLDDFGRAQDGFATIIRDEPNHKLAERASYMQGWTLFRQNDDDGAQEHFESFLKTWPDSVWQEDILFWVAERNYNQQKLEEAEKAFANLAARFPDGKLAAQALYWSGRCASRLKAYTRAVEHYTTLIKSYPDHPRVPDAIYGEGEALAILGNCTPAITLFTQLIQEHGDSYLVPAAWNRIGDCQFAHHKEGPDAYLDALASFESALSAKGISISLQLQVMYRIANIYKKREDTDKAITAYTKVVYSYLEHRDRLDREAIGWFHQAAYEAARLLEDQKKYREATSLYRRIVLLGGPEAKEAERRVQALRLERLIPFTP